MYLHTLRLTNVGPFVGETEIDFTQLGQSGLFLLEGPTGSGKSTLLDAIVFALYGQVGSAHASNDRIRSTLADPGQASEVELIFEVPAGIFRVIRTPAYERAKKSGSGTTKNQASVKLWRLSSPDAVGGELLSTRHGEAEAELQTAIGLSREQFVQTVLLPQGEFAAFLRANAEERRAVLQRLFATELYDGITAELDEARRNASHELAVSATRLQAAQVAYRSTVNEFAEQLPETDDPAELEVALATVTAQLQAVVAQAQAQVEAQTLAVDQAAAKLAQLQEKQQAQHRVIDLRQRQESLLAQVKLVDSQRKLLTELRNVEAVASTFATLETNDAQVHRLQRSIEKAHTALQSQLSESELAAPQESAGRLQAELQELAELTTVESQLLADQGRAHRLHQQLVGLQAELAGLAAAESTLPQRIETLTQEQAQTTALTSTLPALQKELDEWDVRRRAASKLERVAGELEELKAAVAEQARVALVAADELAQRNRARIEGIAGELAEGLIDGQPCPVCGSAEHPQPAIASLQTVSAADVQRAEQTSRQAAERLAQLRNEFDAVNVTFTELSAGSAGLALTHIDQRLAECEAKFKQASAALHRQSELERELTELNQTLAANRQRRDIAAAELLAAQTEHAAVLRDIELQQQQVQAARGEFTSIAARQRELTQTLELLYDYADLSGKHRQQLAEQQARRTQWQQTLAQLGIDSEARFIDLRDQLIQIPVLETRIRTHDTELAGVTEALADSQVIDLTDQDLNPQVREATEQVAACRSALQESTQRLGRLRAISEQATERGETLLKQAATHAELAESVAEIVNLSEIANGTSAANLQRMPLPTYVLVTRFREVVAAANSRLATMSDGRYSLEHTSAKESRGRKSGLGLIVHDHHTESVRNPGNLSGGESFYTSLALALGLADVVCAEAGGLHLSTLFIDEGFGTLDSQTLDNVLSEITKLRDGGRVVGLVSHVEELKQRIPDRITVTPAGNGSSTVRVTA